MPSFLQGQNVQWFFSIGSHSSRSKEVKHWDNVQGGIFTRGVPIDIPALRGVDYLEPGEVILPEELTAWENRTGVRIQPGDVVLIRTGRWAAREAKGPWSVNDSGAAGLHATCGRWIKARDIAMLGSDAGSDVAPSGVEGVTHPIHVLALHAMGVHILDCCDLEELHRVTQKLQRWDFFTASRTHSRQGWDGITVESDCDLLRQLFITASVNLVSAKVRRRC